MTKRSLFWDNHLRVIDAEGISARAYARREGLEIQSLSQWRQKLGSESTCGTIRFSEVGLDLPAQPDPFFVGESDHGFGAAEPLMHSGYQVSQIFLNRNPMDFRKSINGLAAIVEMELHMNIFSGALFLVVNRGRDKKILIGLGMAFFSGTSGLRQRSSSG